MMSTMVASRLIPAALTAELGAVGGWPVNAGPTDIYEPTAELRWPLNLAVYDRMRHSDAQQRAIHRSATLPIIRANWCVADTKGVDPRVREFVERELGLTPDNEGRRMTRPGGVEWSTFLRHALLSLVYGHMVFEQVYDIGRSDVAGINFQVANLRKLAPRMPRTLAGFDVANDGGMTGVRQYVPKGNTEVIVTMPIETLVVFTNEREGADWMGQSMFRSSYKHWMLKDTLLRLSALIAERNGMGVPVVTYEKEGGVGKKNEALKIATQVRAGDETGVAMEEGMTLSLEGVKGAIVDLLPWVKYHDQAAAKGSLQMFLDLGHDAGARALGDTFVDYFLMAQTALVDELSATITDHVVRDLVRLNFGPDEPYPAVSADDLNTDTTTTALALWQLEQAGILIPDDPLEEDMRKRYSLPAPDLSTRRVPGPGKTAPGEVPVGTVDPTTGLPAGQAAPMPAGAPAGPPAPGLAKTPRITTAPGRPTIANPTTVVAPSPAPGSGRPRIAAATGVDAGLLERARVAYEQIQALAGGNSA